MKIELKEITVRELSTGYEDNEEAGVVGFDGKAGDAYEVFVNGELIDHDMNGEFIPKTIELEPAALIES